MRNIKLGLFEDSSPRKDTSCFQFFFCSYQDISFIHHIALSFQSGFLLFLLFFQLSHMGIQLVNMTFKRIDIKISFIQFFRQFYNCLVFFLKLFFQRFYDIKETCILFSTILQLFFKFGNTLMLLRKNQLESLYVIFYLLLRRLWALFCHTQNTSLHINYAI